MGSTKAKKRVPDPWLLFSWGVSWVHSFCTMAVERSLDTYRAPTPYKSSLPSLSYAEMDLATVPEAPPTTKNQRATSCPAPISAKEPKVDVSRLKVSALWWVSGFSGEGMI